VLKKGFAHFHSSFLPNLSLNPNSLLFSNPFQIWSGERFLEMWIFVFRVGNQQQEMGGGEGINTHPEKLAVGLLSSGIFGKHYYKTGLTEAL